MFIVVKKVWKNICWREVVKRIRTAEINSISFQRLRNGLANKDAKPKAICFWFFLYSFTVPIYLLLLTIMKSLFLMTIATLALSNAETNLQIN
jgi:hypothetical protein